MCKSIELYIKWCKERGLKPSHANSLLIYRLETKEATC